MTTKQRLLLLDENDLKELGFLMGPRKQIHQWIRAENGQQTPTGTCNTLSHSSTPSRASSPVPSTSWQSMDSIANSPVTATPVSGARARAHIRKFQVNGKLVS